ncbi:MAG: quinone-dependent dihydroorotate dehydrogenase [Rickettsiales bacterium]|nr:quinone-dependent dihydroorotate dehydrogenase [Rickettsiales bacterium]
MSYYRKLQPLLFSLEPEKAHDLSIMALKYRLLPKQQHQFPRLKCEAFNTTFRNPIGLAAGLDKHAEGIKSLFDQNFGFVEVGTVTPAPQDGNPKPRLFRLEEDEAIINRFGFNSKGAHYFKRNLERWKASKHCGNGKVLGANFGKTKTTDRDVDDYVQLMDELYGLSDYITINISSPNTPGLRDIQDKERLDELLGALKDKKNQLIKERNITVPLLVKISPDMGDDEAYKDIANLVQTHEINGIIVSNTTIQLRDQLKSKKRNEQGGLSGKILTDLSTEILGKMYRYTDGAIPLIGVGGVASGRDAYRKIAQGASLVQIYTALIYQGFELITEILEYLDKKIESQNCQSITDLVGIENSF